MASTVNHILTSQLMNSVSPSVIIIQPSWLTGPFYPQESINRLSRCCRVQGGVLAVRQGWRRDDNDQRAGHSDEVAGTKPHGGRAAGHDQRGGCGW